MREIEALGAGAGLDAAAIAQAGNGAIHATVAGADREVLQVVRRLRDGLGAEGGSVVLERAPVTLKRNLDVWGPAPAAAFALMERIKRELDPLGILNPGRFVGGL
jgi:glycolate oxidase FAD binding subunit